MNIYRKGEFLPNLGINETQNNIERPQPLSPFLHSPFLSFFPSFFVRLSLPQSRERINGASSSYNLLPTQSFISKVLFYPWDSFTSRWTTIPTSPGGVIIAGFCEKRLPSMLCSYFLGRDQNQNIGRSSSMLRPGKNLFAKPCSYVKWLRSHCMSWALYSGPSSFFSEP